MLSLNIYLTGKILFICIDVTENANCKFIIHHNLITVSGKFHQYIDKYEDFIYFLKNIFLFQKPERVLSMPILHSGGNHFRPGILELIIHHIDPLHKDSKNVLIFNRSIDCPITFHDNSSEALVDTIVR